MEKINGPRTQAFRVRRGEPDGLGKRHVHVQSRVQQRATGHEVFESGKCGITFAGDMLSVTEGMVRR